MDIGEEVMDTLEDMLLSLAEQIDIAECWPGLQAEAEKEPMKPVRIEASLAAARQRRAVR
jgi:hypothetical protein